MTATRAIRHPEPATAHHRPGRAAALPPEERRAAIVAAATPLLRQRGHDVTTREIAQAAGIAEGTIFRAFPTKQSVVDAVLASACDMSETIRMIGEIDRSEPLETRVRNCCTILGDRLSSIIDLMITLRMHGPPHPDPQDKDTADRRPQHGQRRRRHRDQHLQVIAAITDLLAADAERLALPPERAAHLLRLLTFAGTHRMINDDDPLTADEVTDVLLYGIARGPDERGLPPPAAGG